MYYLKSIGISDENNYLQQLTEEWRRENKDFSCCFEWLSSWAVQYFEVLKFKKIKYVSIPQCVSVCL